MHCTNCGNEVFKNYMFCKNCGNKIIYIDVKDNPAVTNGQDDLFIEKSYGSTVFSFVVLMIISIACFILFFTNWFSLIIYDQRDFAVHNIFTVLPLIKFQSLFRTISVYVSFIMLIIYPMINCGIFICCISLLYKGRYKTLQKEIKEISNDADEEYQTPFENNLTPFEAYILPLIVIIVIPLIILFLYIFPIIEVLGRFYVIIGTQELYTHIVTLRLPAIVVLILTGIQPIIFIWVLFFRYFNCVKIIKFLIKWRNEMMNKRKQTGRK